MERSFEGPLLAQLTQAGEICFNTAMTGYQEVLTDPSYRGQIVAMTYPLIGNYGVNLLDVESAAPQVRGFVIEELSPLASNWRRRESLINFSLSMESRDRGHRYPRPDTAAAQIAAPCVPASQSRLSAMTKPSPCARRPNEGADFVQEVTTPLAYEWDVENR